LPDLERLLVRYPDWDWGLQMRAQLIWFHGGESPEAAARAFEQALAAPSRTTAEEDGDPADAACLFLVHGIDRYACDVNLGTALLGAGRCLPAVRQLEQTRLRYPDEQRSDAYAAPLEAWIRAIAPGLPDEEAAKALPLALEAHRRFPRHADVSETLAAAYARVGDWAHALDLARASVRPGAPTPHFLAAQALWGLGRKDEAERSYDTGLEILASMVVEPRARDAHERVEWIRRATAAMLGR
jgi:tetratricopeptide (TPR) repeat protein